MTGRDGLHIRPCQQLAQCARQFRSRITITNLENQRTADAAQPLQLMTLGAQEHSKLDIDAVGEDSHSAVQAILRLFETNFSAPAEESNGTADASQ